MKGCSWLMIPLLAASTACADATAPAERAPERAVPRATLGSGWDIVTQTWIPANATCGHYATYDGSAVVGLDWRVNGSVVALDAEGIDYTNNGSAYTVSVGEWDGSSFTSYYSETFYPQGSGACLQLGV